VSGLAFVTRKLDHVIATDTIAHLLTLPIDYFHPNPSGVTAYKLQEAINVRDFLASRLFKASSGLNGRGEASAASRLAAGDPEGYERDGLSPANRAVMGLVALSSMLAILERELTLYEISPRAFSRLHTAEAGR
jgi:hypothetical protein